MSAVANPLIPELESVPKHVAIIMDGNGRWATGRGRPRLFGHIRGSAQVRPIVRECGRLGVKFLTLYAFSEENWGRPATEVNVLMRLLKKYLLRERKTLMDNDVRLLSIGDISHLPSFACASLEETIELTKNNKGLTLTFALSYGSRQEILAAVKKIASEVKEGTLNVGAVSDETIRAHLETRNHPDPDLIIRTSGEKRISNFLLWQMAYSEFYFTDRLWPEFDIAALHAAFEEFGRRKRRYGLVTEAGRKIADEKTGLSAGRPKTRGSELEQNESGGVQ